MPRGRVRRLRGGAFDSGLQRGEDGADLAELLLGRAQFLPLGPYEAAVGGDTFEDALAASRDLAAELLVQRIGEPLPDGRDLSAHLLLPLFALCRQDEESECREQ